MLASVVVIDGAPFDVQDSIRRNAGNRGVDATGATGISRAARVCICALVVPVREDGEVVAEPRQANVSPGVIRCRKLRIAVGRQIDRVERLVVQSVREWQRNGGDRIIPVIADVGFPWHATVLYRSYHVLADARCRCCGWACRKPLLPPSVRLSRRWFAVKVDGRGAVVCVGDGYRRRVHWNCRCVEQQHANRRRCGPPHCVIHITLSLLCEEQKRRIHTREVLGNHR